MLAEVAAFELPLRREPVEKNGPLDAQRHCEHHVGDGDRGFHSCRNFLGWHTLPPLVIIMFAHHNLTEYNISLSFEQGK
jgi:hypothetical protein